MGLYGDNTSPTTNSTGMDPSTISSMIGVGGSLLGDIFNLFGSSKANREQRNYATGVMNQQREWSLEDLKNQQEYNSPIQQMSRLKAAGLNPNLVYGTGIQAAGQSEQPRAVASANFTPQNELSGFQNLGEQLMEAQNLGVSLQEKKAQTENIKSHTLQVDLLNSITQDSPEIAGLTVIDEVTGEKKYVSAQDFLAKLGGAKMDTALFNTKSADYLQRSNFSQNQINAVQAEIAIASRSESLLAAMQKGQQAITDLVNSQKDSELKTQQLANLKKAWDSMDATIKLQNQQREYNEKNFGNNPILQQLFKTALLAGLAIL